MPVTLRALLIDRDDRLGSYCVTATCNYEDFLTLTAGAEQNLDIQRSIIKGAKAYATLRSDLRRGCVLPPVVLAVNIALQENIETAYAEQRLDGLTQDFSHIASNDVYVIDGLQRTNAIRQTLQELNDEQRVDFLQRALRVEIWVNIPFGAIAYRMLLLNAGQRPMSVRHQVEVLSSKLIDDLSDIDNLDIFRIGDARRRTQPGQFALAKLAQCFQAWLQGQPNLDLRNTVMEELLAESAIEVLGKSVPVDQQADHGDGFRRFVEWLVRLDFSLGQGTLAFLGNETVLLGIAAAIGSLERSETLGARVWPAMNGLLQQAEATAGAALSLNVYDVLKTGIDVGKVNVGVATREMVFNAFKEYIRGAGETPMAECWQLGAARA
ncbi:UNVERIFIED_ORG: hypothetical protein ABIC43_002703 [Variovorax guangxiensis]